MKKEKYTALIILNYNNYEDTINCIESVEKFNTSTIKVIVVDNGSKREGAVEAIDKQLQARYAGRYLRVSDKENTSSLPYMTFVVSERNDGYAQGNNKGLKFAYQDDSIENILILNNDVLFVEDMIGKLIDYQQKLPLCAIVSPILYKKNMVGLDLNCARLNHTNWEVVLMFLFHSKNFFGVRTRSEKRRCLLLHDLSENEEVLNVDLPSGSCMLFKKSLMNDIQIFDDHTFLYFEENILFKQIAHIGKKNYVVKDIKCIHLGASSTSKSRNSFVARKGLESADYYLHRYCNMSIIQKVVWSIAKSLFILKLNTIRRK